MATVSTLPGQLDTRQGYDSGQHFTEAEQAEYWRRRNAGKPRHPSEMRAEAQAREIEREAERRAANPDPRQSLRDAHGRRAEARTELDRIVALRTRATDLVAHLEARHTELVDLVRRGNQQAAAELVGALGQSMDDLPLSPENGALQTQLNSVSGRLGVARDAIQQLSEEHRAAVSAVREAEAGVARCAVALAIEHCVAEGEEIDQLKADLNRRRRDLWSLSAAITSQLRIMPHQAGLLYLPPGVARAIDNLDAAVDPVWSQRLRALHDDPEASL